MEYTVAKDLVMIYLFILCFHAPNYFFFTFCLYDFIGYRIRCTVSNSKATASNFVEHGSRVKRTGGEIDKDI